MPVYASAGQLPNGLKGYGAISVNVTTTSQPPIYSAGPRLPCAGTLPAATASCSCHAPPGGANPIGTTVGFPRTPNSLMFNFQRRIYMGSEQGLMYVDVGASSRRKLSLVSSQSTPCNVTLCGNVLAISNDGKQVVVSDNVSATPQVYIYNLPRSGRSGHRPYPSQRRHRRCILARSVQDLHPHQRRHNVCLLHCGCAERRCPFRLPGPRRPSLPMAALPTSREPLETQDRFPLFQPAPLPATQVRARNSCWTIQGTPLQIFPSPNLNGTWRNIWSARNCALHRQNVLAFPSRTKYPDSECGVHADPDRNDATAASSEPADMQSSEPLQSCVRALPCTTSARATSPRYTRAW